MEKNTIVIDSFNKSEVMEVISSMNPEEQEKLRNALMEIEKLEDIKEKMEDKLEKLNAAGFYNLTKVRTATKPKRDKDKQKKHKKAAKASRRKNR